MNTKLTTATDRVAISLPEARLEHGLSQRRLASLAGVSASTIRKVERGGSVDAALLIRLGAALLVLDAYQPPRFEDHVARLTEVPRGRLELAGRQGFVLGTAS